MEQNKRYYQYLDIIRIILCFAVLLYHVNIIKGGYLAVSAFFVLSGYLTCVSAFKKEKFSIKEYYSNKLIKIYLPVLITVFLAIPAITLCKSINWLNLKPETLSVIFGYNNFWQLSAKLDYFARHTDSPFMHLWYIAIIFQYDLIFPLIYLIIKKAEKKINKKIICITTTILATIGAIIFYISSLGNNMMFSYYNTFTRMFSLIFGLAVGLIHIYYGPMIAKKFKDKPYRKIMFCVYVLILIILFTSIGVNSKLFQISMIISTLITCRLIEYATIITTEKTTKTQKIIKFIAGMSYEIYLVQYPIIYLFQYIEIINILKIFLILVLTLILSYILKFALSTDKRALVPKNILRIVLLIIMLFGSYKFWMEKDYTEEMKKLEEQLGQNEDIMQEKLQQYQTSYNQEKENINMELEKIENYEEKMDEVLANLQIVGVGDSVMLGAVDNLYKKFPNGYFDAKISRTGWVVNEILQKLKNQNMLGEPVILHLGTNGDCPESCKTDIMKTCEGKEVFWLTVTNDKDVKVNAKIEAFAQKYNNLHIIDWNNISKGHPEYFVADGIHLTVEGMKAYTDTIYNEIRETYLQEYKAKKEEIMKNKEEEKNKVSFFGNNTLLNAFQEIQTNFEKDKFIINKEFKYDTLKNEIENAINNDTLTNKIVLMLDKNANINKTQYQELVKICKERKIYIVVLNENMYKDLSNLEKQGVTIINFYKEIKTHNNYIELDKIHLTADGNKALSEMLKNVIKQ